jgi:hypothetical protein
LEKSLRQEQTKQSKSPQHWQASKLTNELTHEDQQGNKSNPTQNP